MSIQVPMANNPEGGYSTDYAVVTLRHGMQMAFPDDDISVTDGSDLSNESAEVITPENFDGHVEIVLEDANLFDRLQRRGVSRGDIPAIKAALGDAYPKNLPDEIFSITPSKNGMSYVAESFTTIIAEKFKAAMTGLWKMLTAIYHFIATKVKEAAKRLYDFIFRSKVYVGTTDSILADIKLALGDEWPEFERRLDKTLTPQYLYAELNARGQQVNLDAITDKKLMEQARRLSAIAKEMSDKLTPLVAAYLTATKAASKSGNVSEEQDLLVAETLGTVITSGTLSSDKFLTALRDCGIDGIDTADVAGSANAIQDFFRRQGERERNGKVYRTEGWVDRFKSAIDNAEIAMAAVDEANAIQAVADRAAEVEKQLAGTNGQINEGFEESIELVRTASGIILSMSRILLAVSRKVIDYDLLVQQGRDLAAKYNSIKLRSYQVILDDEGRWSSQAQLLKDRVKKEVANTGIGKTLFAPTKEYFNAKDDQLASGKDMKDITFLSFVDEVSGCTALDGDDNLVEVRIAANNAVNELAEAEYRSHMSGSISPADESLYRELRQEYLPHQPSDVSMEGFSILKTTIIGVAFIAAYKIIERLIRWIKELIAKRRAGTAVVEKKLDKIVQQEEQNQSVAAPTEEMMKTLNACQPTKEMLKAAGVGDSTGQGSSNLDETTKPLSVQDKMRAVNSVMAEARNELLKHRAWSRFQDACTTVTVGYLRDSRLENIIRLIRQQRPERVAYLTDQCREIDLALSEQKNVAVGEVAPRLAQLHITWERGRKAYQGLFDQNLMFTYGNLTASAHLPEFNFSSFGTAVLDSGEPIYPTEETMAEIIKALKSSAFLAFTLPADEANNDAIKRFSLIETQFKKLRDAAQQIKAVPENQAIELNQYVDDINKQITELGLWYAFEEALRNQLNELLDALDGVVQAKAEITDKLLSPLGLKDWTKKK